MTFLHHLRMGERLGALVLLLLLLAVLTGVSLTQAGLLDSAADQLEDQTLPNLHRAHDLRRMVDEARGLEALYLLSADDAERRDIEAQLLRQRERLQGQWLTHAARRSVGASAAGGDDAERRLQAQVGERLNAWWAVQDQVLAATRHAAQQAAPAGRARTLLTGPSQAAWQALGQSLDQWQRHQTQRAAEQAQRSRLQANWLRGVSAAVLGMVLVAAVLLLRHLRAGGGTWAAQAGGSAAAEGAGLPAALDTIAMHSRLLALNAAVQAARSGEPTAADRAERNQLATEAEALARRCDAARRGLRLGPSREREPDPS